MTCSRKRLQERFDFIFAGSFFEYQSRVKRGKIFDVSHPAFFENSLLAGGVTKSELAQAVKCGILFKQIANVHGQARLGYYHPGFVLPQHTKLKRILWKIAKTVRIVH